MDRSFAAEPSTSTQAPPPSDSPLSPEQHQQFAKANQDAARITKAAGTASFNGWSMIFLAVCCVPFVLMDTTNIFVGVVVGGVGVVELIGRGRILQMDPTAGRMLAINQLVLMAAILIYCAWSIYVGLQYPSELATNPDLKSLNFDIAGLEKTLIWVLYGTVAAGSVIYQGLCALFYLNTGRRLRDYIQQTPPWIIQLQRGG